MLGDRQKGGRIISVQRPPTAYLLPVVARTGIRHFPSAGQLLTKYITRRRGGRQNLRWRGIRHSLRLLNEKATTAARIMSRQSGQRRAGAWSWSSIIVTAVPDRDQSALGGISLRVHAFGLVLCPRDPVIEVAVRFAPRADIRPMIAFMSTQPAMVPRLAQFSGVSSAQRASAIARWRGVSLASSASNSCSRRHLDVQFSHSLA